MLINCQYPTIIRIPEFNKLITQGFTEIYYKSKCILRLNHKQVKLALSNSYISIPELQINQGYELNDLNNNKQNLPQYVKNVYQFHTVNGIITKIYSEDYLKIVKPNRSQYHRIFSISYEEITNYTIVNPLTGEFKEIFQLVDCCHCVLCQKKRRNRISSRAVLESINHQNPPLFVTLTYSQEHYNFDVKDVTNHTREIQLFNKRLRKALQPYQLTYKYIFVSEFGSKFGRLHYHALLFGLNEPELMELENNQTIYRKPDAPKQVYKLTNIISKAWNKGIIELEEAKDLSGKYVSKYIGKSSDGKQTKVLKSIKLGAKFLTQDKIEEIRQNTSKNSFYVLVNNNIEEIPLYSWIATKVYPSLARQLSQEFRELLFKTYKDLVYYDTNFYLYRRTTNSAYYKPFMEKYGKFIKLLGYDDLIPKADKTEHNHFTFVRLNQNINKLNTYNYDIDEVIRINDLRNEHIELSNIIDYDVDYNSYIENQYIAARQNAEKDCQ